MKDLFNILGELTEKYTSKESSSVSYDTARMLMNAIIYTINECSGLDTEKSEGINSGILTEELAFRSDNPRILYDKGSQLIISKTVKAKELFNRIAQNFNSYGSICYYDTVIKGMPAFFLYYDSKFNPQNHILTLDYPTIKSLDQLCGIDAIYVYLKYTYLEQYFLSSFDYKTIISLLTSIHSEYEELLINISSVVLRNALACMMVKKDYKFLKIEISDVSKICDFVENRTKKELQIEICSLINLLVQYGYNNNQTLFKYLVNDARDFATELKNATENNCLDVIFPMQ